MKKHSVLAIACVASLFGGLDAVAQKPRGPRTPGQPAGQPAAQPAAPVAAGPMSVDRLDAFIFARGHPEEVMVTIVNPRADAKCVVVTTNGASNGRFHVRQVMKNGTRKGAAGDERYQEARVEVMIMNPGPAFIRIDGVDQKNFPLVAAPDAWDTDISAARSCVGDWNDDGKVDARDLDANGDGIPDLARVILPQRSDDRDGDGIPTELDPKPEEASESFDSTSGDPLRNFQGKGSAFADAFAKAGPTQVPMDPRIRDGRGWTPLHYAAFKNLLKPAENLVKAGADVNAQDKAGWTPLHRACYQGHLDMAKWLLKQRADPNAKTGDSRTCAHLAAEKKQAEVLKWLVVEAAKGPGRADQPAAGLAGALPRTEKFAVDKGLSVAIQLTPAVKAAYQPAAGAAPARVKLAGVGPGCVMTLSLARAPTLPAENELIDRLHQVAAPLLAHAVEKESRVLQLQGDQFKFYFLELTDAQPGPGEDKFGVFGIGVGPGVVCDYMLVSAEKNSAVKQAMIKAVSTLRVLDGKAL